MRNNNKHLNLSHQLPPIVFGTSGLGNLYVDLPFEEKLAIVKECIKYAPGKVVFDTAGKYGAGLSLESIGKSLSQLGVEPSEVLISNKLGWYQVPLIAEEPTFEPGVWKGLKNDAVQKISYDGILSCFHQGNALLGGYTAQLVSVHDPDEYLANARNLEEEEEFYRDILDAYRALAELKAEGKVLGIGVGAKNWKVVQRIANDVALDWVMIANSLTIYNHPKELVDFIGDLGRRGVAVINSAVFNGGFLVGSDYYNYQLIDRETEEGKALYAWRDKFWELCAKFDILPAEACFNFGFNISGVCSVALNTTKSEKVRNNAAMATKDIPAVFWNAMREEGLILL
ncbi:aldo/keto reductase [Sphingobacterium chuzhouense]|uniref:Aldo/keto reductase n=1 Tax=Sphingobacterium chuzhouense TaxID=1742264 RepID=A0ABR7XU27_9SPHI|nr:aldo/keto reductase [Sphingobacterium chuzhouense]MBD1422147.1 aldo/keto reductase [Sphingobacterium chuzhouense]